MPLPNQANYCTTLAYNQHYKNFYPTMHWRCNRAINDEVVASGMVQEAFLKLWHLKDEIHLKEQVFAFLKAQVKQAISGYYKSNVYRFHRNLFRLDELEEYDFMVGYEEEENGEVMDNHFLEEEAEQREQWERIHAVIPNLSERQQLLVKLCLKYNFNYERMAWHLGGISDYEVARQIEKMLTRLKAIVTDSQKLKQANKQSKIVYSGNLDELQMNVMQMRYELQYGFEEIADNLGLSLEKVKEAFARACRVCR